MQKSIAKLLGTSLGFGYAPFAPGTFGTLFGVITYVLLYWWIPQWLNAVLIVLIVVFTAIGTWCCQQVADEWGHDPSRIVLDETIGLWITLLFVPFNWWYVLIAFVLFRFFDILKPLGIRAIDEKMDNAFSVMLDDVLAGVYAWIVLQVFVYLVPNL